jgi:hypothetical protein
MRNFSRERAFAFKRKPYIHYLYGFQENPFYSLYFFVIDILSRKFVGNINPDVFYLTGREKRQFITLPLQVGDTMVRNLCI